MSDALNPVQSTSYTNKDFQTLFPELLDLTKVLTSRWDPTVSNESDPGVVLLKLNAIIADKLNYNIDKNVLECFPLSVTQETNARQLFDQLGYRMKWYKSNVCDISMKWNGDIADGYVTIPAFTMVSDSDNSIVYTLVGTSDGVDDEEFAVGSQDLNYNGTTISFKAIEGIAITYDVNGETTIKLSDLDSNNRLYFNTYNIAENGIFITNANSNNYSSWIKKENLIAESLGNTYYSFGLSEDGTTCYIQFPDDIDSLIKDGLNIIYIKSSGSEGSASIGTIDKFYNDVYLTDSSGNNVTLSTDNTKISNYATIVAGSDPETIDEAYSNYKKTVGTFDTLVTLRDYINYILTSGLVSNCFVCDRTNDVQTTYSIITLQNNLDSIETAQEQVYTDKSVIYNGSTVTASVPENALSSFDLKLYLFENVPTISTSSEYNQTFNLLSNEATATIKAYLEDRKSICHDYADILPATTTSAHICFFKNKYPITCKIVTKYQLTTAQAQEVSQNIRQAFFDNISAKNMDFSDSVSLELLNNIITNADTRVKSAIIDNIEYQTYAIYFDGSSFKEVNITYGYYEPISTQISYTGTLDYDITASYIVGAYCLYKGNRYKCTTAINAPAGNFVLSKWTDANLRVAVDETTFTNKIGVNNYKSYTFIYNSGWKDSAGNSVTLSQYGITVSGTAVNGDVIVVALSIATQIRHEVYAKSVLAGTTNLFKQDGVFDYKFNQRYINVYENIDKISSNVDITLTNKIPQYVLKDNEYLQFYAPNFIDSTSYSNYVKFEANVGIDIQANADYQLKQNEYIIFYWKTDDDTIDVYNYYVYAQGNIIHPSFNIGINSTTPVGASLATSSALTNIGTDDNPVYVASTELNGPMSTTISDAVTTLTNKSYILSGSKSVTIRKLNQITLDSSYYCYWVLNNKEKNKYILFENDDTVTSQTYLLGEGEYFFYSNKSLTELSILGAGSTISRNSGIGSWIVSADLPLEDILEKGTVALQNYWQHPIAGQTTNITENQYVTLGPGTALALERKDTTVNWSITFSSTSELSEELVKYNISYLGKNDTDWTELGSVNVNTSYTTGWNAKSFLYINSDANQSQRLLANQTLTITDSDGIETVLTGSGITQDSSVSTQYYYPTVFKSDTAITYDGKGDLEISAQEGIEDIVYPSIYVYSEYITRTDKSITVTSAEDLAFTLPASTSSSSVTYNINLPAGNYLFRLSQSAIDLTNLQLKIDSTNVTAIWDNTISNFANFESIICTMTSTGTLATLTLTVSAHSNEIIISLTDLLKVQKLDTFGSTIMAKISELDHDHKYNYIYQVDEDNGLSDPLLPSAFLDSGHIFNDYVICQMDTTNSNIYILNKK